MEVSFCFPLPYDGAIDQMTFMVDGKEYEAKLLPAKEARDIYLSHVRRNEDPALLEWIGTGMFKTSVFPVPPGAERKVTIEFTQLLRHSDRLTDFLYPLATAKFTAQPIKRFSFNASIVSKAKIKSVYSPTHPIKVERPDDHRALVELEATDTIPSSDLRLLFDISGDQVGASLISYRPDPTEDGYFLLLASPEVQSASTASPPKTVIFTMDRSGSMSGKKISQAQEALRFVLNNLSPGDLFNIVVYDSQVESFRPELQRFDEESRKRALGFVDSIYSGGSTNIGEALTTALQMIQDPERPSYLLFLTDGLPTSGETNEMKIAELAKQKNAHRTRMINFGVGYDVNSRLLDRLSRDNFGQSEFVRPDEDIEQVVSRLYRRMSTPIMMDVDLQFQMETAADDAVPVINRIYPRQMLDLFAGQQVVVVGRYKTPGDVRVSIKGTVADEPAQFSFSGTLVESSPDQSFAFVETLWAVRRIGEIIDQLDLSGQNEELIAELVGLSTKYGIMTPYTSFLADESASMMELASESENLDRARNNLSMQLSVADGQSGFEQRAAKKSYREADQAAPAFGGFGGLGFSSSAAASPSPGGRNSGLGAGGAPSQTPPESAVWNIGNQALYKRGNIWVAENVKDVDLQRDQSKIQVIERFSDEYFQLIAENDSTQNAILAQQPVGHELLVIFRGQVYHIR
jgi:Ca-activated chloride channel homolog